MENLAQKAIRAALEKDWKKAEKINLEILACNSHDIPSLNRLSLAQVNLGKIKEAKKTLKLVLVLDPSNPIANKHLKRLKLAKEIQAPSTQEPTLASDLFLEEKGKTKTIPLLKPAEPEVLSNLSIGEKLILAPKRNKLHVKKEKAYIGSLPDLFVFHLLPLIKKGYRYEVYVRRVEPKTISVFIKEAFKPKKFRGIPSFV